jgi:hypothetical protein
MGGLGVLRRIYFTFGAPEKQALAFAWLRKVCAE